MERLLGITYIKMFSNVLDADLALCTTDKFLENNSLFQKAKFKWIFEEYDDFFDYYREHFDKNWENYFNKGLDTGLYTSGSIHFVFKDYILKKPYPRIKNLNILFTQGLINYIYPLIL